MLASLVAGSPRAARPDLIDVIASRFAALRTPHHPVTAWSSWTCLSALSPSSGSLLSATSQSVAAQAASSPTAPSASGISQRDGGRSAGSNGSADGSGGSHWSRRWQPLLLVPGSVAALLGYWQLQRRQEKSEMLDRRRAAMEARPHWAWHLVSCLVAISSATAQHSDAVAPLSRARMSFQKAEAVT